MITTRLHRRHFSSTPSTRNRARRLPQRQRLSCPPQEEAKDEPISFMDEIENHFQLELSRGRLRVHEQEVSCLNPFGSNEEGLR
jgi:hypothetical protein